MPLPQHQYLERDSGEVRTERLLGDRMIQVLYGRAREQAPALFRMFTSADSSRLLGYLNYDLPLRSAGSLLRQLNINTAE